MTIKTWIRKCVWTKNVGAKIGISRDEEGIMLTWNANGKVEASLDNSEPVGRKLKDKKSERDLVQLKSL